MKSVLRPQFDAAAATGQTNGHGYVQSMPVDVSESDSAFTLWADLPGVRKEDISITITSGQVTLSAVAKEEKAVDQGQGRDVTLVKERRAGNWHREFRFAVDIDDSKAQAEFTDGVLRLTLPKRESAQVKRLAIH
jgi:HSP20 family protein